MSLPNVICVVGSSNTDMVVKAEKLPSPGETVIGEVFLMNPGGKGANQAVAAARLDGNVVLAAKVGNDVFGKQAIQQFKREKINPMYITIDSEHPSGVALINVDAKGENCISVAPGSNSRLMPHDVELILDGLNLSDIVLLQLEIPLKTVDFVIRSSFEKGLRVILNPAPAQELPVDLFRCLYLITPNETEAEILTGIRVTDMQTVRQAAEAIRAKGVPNVIITLGSKGAFLHTDTISTLIPAPPVTAVDTTAAGDCFNGALAVALAENSTLEQAIAFACKAAAICVTRMGAQTSLPHRREVNSLPLINPVIS
ncbi:ribokinase [Dyadobacter sp. NIV53]|uniref:ribokinase n=1 Tax=Dyadobacter sp. NIV53 TaxID=2861765 RepID=UPI001C86C9E3|nr:ribokinase [Dyadobacter sp. NIV53]